MAFERRSGVYYINIVTAKQTSTNVVGSISALVQFNSHIWKCKNPQIMDAKTLIPHNYYYHFNTVFITPNSNQYLYYNTTPSQSQHRLQSLFRRTNNRLFTPTLSNNRIPATATSIIDTGNDDDKEEQVVVSHLAGNESIWNQLVEIAKFSGPAAGLWLCGPLMSLIDTAVIGQSSSVELAALGYLGYLVPFRILK